MSGEPTPHPDAQEWYCATCDRSYGAGVAFCPEDGTRLVRLTEGDAMLGKVIDGRFTIRERLGQGGMGVVYRAWQASVGREVAIKMIRPRPGHDASTAKRFLREAKLASQLSQPSTVGVIDFGQADDGTLYLVMELLRGRTLADVLRDHGRMSPERTVRIGTQVCDALEAAQRLGIVHRDVKPANVMILDEPPGRDLIKVLDFGLAKVIDSDESTVTQSGRMVGTPSHLPPEVALGAAATHRSDLYALGVLLFEMLDGRPPFSADNVNMMVAMHAYQPAPELGPHVPRALAQVVARTLAKRPEARPETAAQLRQLLEAALRGETPAPNAIEVTADSDEQRRQTITRSSPVNSPEALAETLRKPKTRPPIKDEVQAAGAAIEAKAAGGDARKPAEGDARKPAGGDAGMPAGGDAGIPAGGDADKTADGDARKTADGDARKTADGDARKTADWSRTARAVGREGADAGSDGDGAGAGTGRDGARTGREGADARTGREGADARTGREGADARTGREGANAATPTTTADDAATLRRRRWPLLVLLFALLGGAAAVAVAKLGGEGPAAELDAGSALAIPPAEPSDAAIIDAPAVDAPVDAPIDAAAIDAAAIDARIRHRPDARPVQDSGRRDAGATVEPPPKRDAGPCHPWQDDC